MLKRYNQRLCKRFFRLAKKYAAKGYSLDDLFSILKSKDSFVVLFLLIIKALFNLKDSDSCDYSENYNFFFDGGSENNLSSDADFSESIFRSDTFSAIFRLEYGL